MVGCFGPSKADIEIQRLRNALQEKEAELQRLSLEGALNKKTQTAQQEKIEQLEAQLNVARQANHDYMTHSEQEVQKLQSQLGQQHELVQNLESQLKDEQQQRGDLQQEAEQQRMKLEEQLAKEKQQRTDQQRTMEKNVQHLQRRLQAEEQRSKRLQKQIANFTETMEAVSSVLTAVEREQKSVSSPVRVDRKARSSVADQLRQSLAAYKRAQEDDAPDDTSKP